MDKRYQVFVSSTYADLKEERQKVIQALMEMDCIPSGMELFPAADEEQFEFIKKVIDDCDYYLLIIGGRYGSVGADGFSYTEKEYQYAIEREIKVVALLHEAPDQIPIGKSEVNETLRERLRVFRESVKTGRLVRFWKSADELPGLVALSLSKTIKTYPAVGWIRADKASNEEVLTEINELRKENVQLNQLNQQLQTYIQAQQPKVQDLAGLTENVTFSIGYWHNKSKFHKDVTLTWAEIFALIAPYLLSHPSDVSVQLHLTRAIEEKLFFGYDPISVKNGDYETVKVQLSALGLVNVEYTPTTNGGMGLFWSLTPKGQETMLRLRTVKKS